MTRPMRAPLDPAAVATAFERIADRIQKRTGLDRVAALQRACSEHPDAFERYCAAMMEATNVRSAERSAQGAR
jgi:antirestriction protein